MSVCLSRYREKKKLPEGGESEQIKVKKEEEEE
jgi:hypothetical protein